MPAWVSKVFCMGNADDDELRYPHTPEKYDVEQFLQQKQPDTFQSSPAPARPTWRDEAMYTGPVVGSYMERPSSRASSARKRPWFAPRRPLISAPSNFRHVSTSASSTSSSTLQPADAVLRPRSFHPLELRMYENETANDRLSRIFLYMDQMEERMGTRNSTIQSRAQSRLSRVQSAMWDMSSSSTRKHEASWSDATFHRPRRSATTMSASASVSTSREPTPPIPARSRLRRSRAYTSPGSVERIVERIALAMQEKDKLQAQIESVIERQSVYYSRPSTAQGFEEFGPMPDILAVPGSGPSFAEWLTADGGRPRTAPNRLSSAEVDAAFCEVAAVIDALPLPPSPYTRVRTESPSGRFRDDKLFSRPLQPPLPLQLRAPLPPLRKKKSFSRVSSWLFPPEQHNFVLPNEVHQHLMDLEGSAGTGTLANEPNYVEADSGFYSISNGPVEMPADMAAVVGSRRSIDSATSAWTSGWDSGEDGVATNFTAATTVSTPATKFESSPNMDATAASFVRKTASVHSGATYIGKPRPTSVGVALSSSPELAQGTEADARAASFVRQTPAPPTFRITYTGKPRPTSVGVALTSSPEMVQGKSPSPPRVGGATASMDAGAFARKRFSRMVHKPGPTSVGVAI